MNLKEFLISIGRLPNDKGLTEKDNKKNQGLTDISEGNTVSESNKRYNTLGEIFDYYKQRDYNSLPDNIQINVPGWPGRPFKGKQRFLIDITNKSQYTNEIQI